MDALQPLRDVLLREEVLLRQLLQAADQMRDALINSDFALLEAASQTMREAGDELDQVENERQSALEAAAAPSIDAALATTTAPARQDLEALVDRLRGTALDLRVAQERNAQLILGAARLRDRWYNLLVGMAAPTYGATGRQRAAAGRRFVSKSA